MSGWPFVCLFLTYLDQNQMKNSNLFRTIILLFFAGLSLFSCNKENISVATELRAPAYPLITIDPYTSAWAVSDNLYDDAIRHWTGKIHSLIGAIRVDGKTYRFLGKEQISLDPIVPMAKYEPWEGKYTLSKPVKNWETINFNAKGWKTGDAAFGTRDMPSLSTPWETHDIWVRREFEIPVDLSDEDIYLIYSHDDTFELYLNGKQLVKTGYEWHNDVELKLDKSMLNPGGKNVIAAHCENRTGGAYVDFGIYQESIQQEVFTQTAKQNSVKLTATQTQYSFTCGPVDLELQFVSPLLMDDLDLLSRPVNYINYEVKSIDGKDHDVQIYFETTPEWAVNNLIQEVNVTKGETANVQYTKAGTIEQPVLAKKGDDLRIDWGYMYLASEKDPSHLVGIGNYFDTKMAFAQNGTLPEVKTEITSNLVKAMPAMVCINKVEKVSAVPTKGYVMIAYDDLESIQYFNKNLKAWWTKNGSLTINDIFEKSLAEYSGIMDKCNAFDVKMWDECVSAGGNQYADLCVLGYRQAIAAHKLVKDTEGNILFLSKENFSNGSIGTVDVTYPSAPLFLKYNPDLLKGMLNPIFYYSESGKWKKPFAAHDVGTYPLANGQTYGGDMPVEECGNMVILAAAIAQFEGNVDYAKKHWNTLTTWANYLVDKGLDPDNQLCTDDFAGHFAHNVNLSVKAIMGVAAYAKMAEMQGLSELSKQYHQEAKDMAVKWCEMADDGDHYRLTFDKPDTWSQKYNLVWDKLLDLDIFPNEVADKELAYYLTVQNSYGLPLDNRRTYTKSDWIMWTATLANDKETFQKFVEPVHKFVTRTPDRVPMSDWYETTDGKKVAFQARSVVGGYFIKLLEEN